MADSIVQAPPTKIVNSDAPPAQAGWFSDPDVAKEATALMEKKPLPKMTGPELQQEAKQYLDQIAKTAPKPPAKAAPAKAAPVAPVEPETAPEEQPPTEPGKPVVPDFDKITKPKAQDWKALNEQRKALRTEVEQLRAKITTGGHDDTALKQLQEERDKLAAIVQEVSTERSPEFRAKYEPLEQSAQDLALSAVSPEQHDDVKRAMALPAGPARNKAFSAIAETLDDWSRGQLIQASSENLRIKAMKQMEINAASANWQKRQAESRMKAEQQQSNYMKMLDAELAKAGDPENGISLFQRTGDPVKDKGVDETAALARYMLNGKMEPQEFVRAVAWAASAPRILASWKEDRKALEAAQERIKQLENAEPTLETTSDEGAPQGTHEEPASSVAEAVTRALARGDVAGVRMR